MDASSNATSNAAKEGVSLPILIAGVAMIGLMLVSLFFDPSDRAADAPLPSSPQVAASGGAASAAAAAAAAERFDYDVAASLPASAPASANAGSAPSLVVHNPCDQPLLLALNYVNAKGERVNEGFFKVPAASQAPLSRQDGPIAVHHATVHYYTETLQSEPVEFGRLAETVGDREVTMKRVSLDLPRQNMLSLECPGFTAGRV